MILVNGSILIGNDLVPRDIIVENGVINAIIPQKSFPEYAGNVFDLSGCWIIPGAVDVHGHLREPGFEHKETIRTGTLSAAKGGITSVMAMPNLVPTPDSLEHLAVQEKIIAEDASVNVYPYASLTVGEKGESLSDVAALAPRVKAFSDDGKGVNDLELLKQGMLEVKAQRSIIASHAEKEGFGMSAEAEYLAVEQELALVRETGCKYHFCHLSTAKSFELVRRAKREGLDVTCEVTPHHMFLNAWHVGNNPNFKMNPPLRAYDDMRATVTAVLDGTADMIATDHAPHAAEEKADFQSAPCGIIGFETMLPLVYTGLVRTGRIDYGKMLELVSYNPAARFGLPKNEIEVGASANLAALDIIHSHTYCKEEIVGKSKNSPFFGTELYGMNVLTVCGGKVVYLKRR